MEKRYIVPEGMLNAACNDHHAIGVNQRDVAKILEAAIRWLDGELEKLVQHPYPTSREFYIAPSLADDYGRAGNNKAIESVRRMFVAPEPEVPEAIKDLLWAITEDDEDYEHNAAILEAFRRGKEAK